MTEFFHGDAARRIGITYHTLTYAVAKGWIRPSFVGGKAIYKLDDLLALRRKRKYGLKKR